MKSFKILSTVAIAILFGSLTYAQKAVTVGGAAMYPTKNIIENAVNSKDHTTLVAAFTAATKVVWSFEFTAFSIMFLVGYIAAPPTVTAF